MDEKLGLVLCENRYGVGGEKGKELERKGWFVVTGFGERTKSQNVRKIGL